MSKVDLKQFINQNKINISLIIFFIFSLYCALTIGETWDYEDNLSRGKITLDYLFSFGELDRNISFREYYSTIYWSLSYLITKQFPSQYQVEISHLINLIFSLSTIIGIGKVTGELFNKKIGKITFLILFFYPIFFGHMAINTKDTILAFSHVWITYLLLKYIKKQEFNRKRNSYIIYLSILAAIGSGIQLVFLGSLAPIILFIIVDIFLIKKIT
jgi:4-amino-4-deoxy-L-arabinose transferase-like glycosyltransferase